VRNGGRMRLVVGCTLGEDEVEAIQQGQQLKLLVQQRLSAMPLEPDGDAERQALELLSWMIARGHLEMRVAVPCDARRQPVAATVIFHEKAGIVEDKAGHRLAFNGSVNETAQGWSANWESSTPLRTGARRATAAGSTRRRSRFNGSGTTKRSDAW